MLLIDGVRYKEWVFQAEDEFEEIIKEHAKDIFGEDSIYFDLKKKLKTTAGIGSIPDGYIVSLQEEPCWYICEVEFHTHPLYEHIIAQLQKIITGAKTLQSQKVVTDAIYNEITGDPFKEALIKSKIGTEDLHHFISKLISKPPILVIPIDQKIDGLEEACDGLPIEKVKIVEFKTFAREGIGLAVHAHLFEPLYKPVIPTVSEPLRPETHVDSMRIKIWRSYIEYGYIGIWKKFRDLFPNAGKTIEIINGDGEIFYADVGDYEGSKQLWDLQKWYRKHPELKEGDIIRITPVVPMKKYRFEILR